MQTSHKWPRFDAWRLFTRYPALDALLKTHPEGCEITVSRQGVWQITPWRGLTPHAHMQYENSDTVWLIGLQPVGHRRAQT